MFIIEILEDGEWRLVSQHTKKVDRDRQLDLMKSNGYCDDVLRTVDTPDEE